MTTRTPAAPPLDDHLEALLRRMRLPHIRRARSSLATRRAQAAFPTGKTFDGWNQALSSIPTPTQAALRTLEWISRAENLVVCGPAGTGKIFLLEALGVLVRRHRADDSVTKAIARILRADFSVLLSTTVQVLRPPPFRSACPLTRANLLVGRLLCSLVLVWYPGTTDVHRSTPRRDNFIAAKARSPFGQPQSGRHADVDRNQLHDFRPRSRKFGLAQRYRRRNKLVTDHSEVSTRSRAASDYRLVVPSGSIAYSIGTYV